MAATNAAVLRGWPLREAIVDAAALEILHLALRLAQVAGQEHGHERATAATVFSRSEGSPTTGCFR